MTNPAKLEELDEKDRSILAQLRSDCHVSQAELGKRVGLSTTAVAARIAKLEKTRHILGYSAFIDYGKVGFNSAAVVNLRLKSTSALNKESLRDILRMPSVSLAYSLTGPYHLSLGVKARGMEDLMKNLSQISRNKNVYEMKAEYLVEQYKSMEEFNPLAPSSSFPPPGNGSARPRHLDDLDLALLRELRSNANILLRELSARLHAPISTVKERIAKLESTGVIRGYVANLDFCKLGYCGAGLFSIKLENNRVYDGDIVSRLSATPDVAILVRTMGYYELQAAVFTGKVTALDVLNRVSATPGVREVLPNSAIAVLKPQYEFNPLSSFGAKQED